MLADSYFTGDRVLTDAGPVPYAKWREVATDGVPLINESSEGAPVNEDNADEIEVPLEQQFRLS